MVLFIILYKVVLTFMHVMKINLKCDHSNGAVYYAKQGDYNVYTKVVLITRWFFSNILIHFGILRLSWQGYGSSCDS